MAENTKSLRTRIKSVDSTLHLTKAMGLVASSKMRRANEGMLHSREYMQGLEGIMNILASSPECKRSPYMKSLGERTRLVIIAGDRGLAGGYNANVFRLAQGFSDAELIPIGKRACDRFANKAVSSEHFSASDSFLTAKRLCADFIEKKYDRLGIISTKYISMMSQQAYLRWVLPIEAKENKSSTRLIFEPDESEIFNSAVLEYVAGVIMLCVRESFFCETTARRMAMDSAGKNANQMIYDLKLEYNRARQGAITQEITEIVAGSDA